VQAVHPDANVIALGANLVNNYSLGAAVTITGRFDLTVCEGDETTPVEIFENLSTDAAQGLAYFRTVVSAGSTRLCADQPAAPVLTPTGQIVLTGGADPSEIDGRFYTGYEADGAYFQPPGTSAETRLGLATLEQVFDVSLVTVPDLPWASTGNLPAVHAALLLHCQRMGERFALVDATSGLSPDQVATWPSQLSGAQPARFGALFYPWVALSFENLVRLVPPSGAIAGLMARSDRLHGVNQAPANLPLVAVVDVATPIDEALQDALNPAGVNCVRKLSDGALTLWGARTLSQELDARYISVRRVLLSVIKALSHDLLWAVFEPLDRRLWTRMSTALNAFFTGLLVRGFTAGAKPADAFFVRCDETTNPPEVTDAGQVMAEVGIALVAPAEFIVLTVRRTPQSLSIVEANT